MASRIFFYIGEHAEILMMKRKILCWKSVFVKDNELLNEVISRPLCHEVLKFLELLKLNEKDVLNKSEG